MSIVAAVLLVALLVPAAVSGSEANITKTGYAGWKDCWVLENPVARVVVVPSIGGRIMEYSTGGRNVIWRNEKELGVLRPSDVGKLWHNYGGHKAWNAPQARWRSPDSDNFYDYAPATAELIPPRPDLRMRGVRLTCAPLPHAGVRFVREVYLSNTSTHVRVVGTMENVSDRPVEWAPWAVTQVETPCTIVFPIDRDSGFEGGWSTMWPQGGISTQTSRIGDLGVVRWAGAVEKIGIDSRAGWLAYLGDRLGYVQQWSVVAPRSLYPDEGCTAQVFTADAAMGGYVEMEPVGPMVLLAPGRSTVLTIDWFLTSFGPGDRSPGSIRERLALLQRRGMLPRTASIGREAAK